MNRKQRRVQDKMATKMSPASLQSAAQAEANRLNDLAIQRHRAGASAEAIALLRQALAHSPDHPICHNNLGELLRLSGAMDEAMVHLDRAVALNPNYAQAHSSRGNLLRQLGQLDEAAAAYRRALRIRPDYPEAMSNLSAVLIDQRQHAAAADLLRQAIALNPKIAMFHKNLGLALMALGDIGGAEAAFHTCLSATVALPEGPTDILISLGDIERFKNNLDGALHWYDKAWRQSPGNGAAHMRFGTALMVKGDYRQAWPHFEARWSQPETAVDKRPFTLPFWRGEKLPPGKKMLLFTEQGVGESLVLWSLMPELLDHGITPVIECDPRMIPILARSFPGLELHPRLNPPEPRLLADDLAVQATLFDVAAVFRHSPADCTGALPLRADAGRVAALSERYRRDHAGPVIGLAWHSKNPKLGAPKSAPLTDFAPFLSLPGLRFVDLQYGNRAEERAALKAEIGVELLYDDDIDQLKDLDSFAAQVTAMDLVISTSNTTAHMAAALGKPTWVLLQRGISPHWYWGLGGTTPWYPTARLMRQPVKGDWRTLAESVAAELKAQGFSPTC